MILLGDAKLLSCPAAAIKKDSLDVCSLSGNTTIQSNSIIVDSIIVENSKIVDDLAATKVARNLVF